MGKKSIKPKNINNNNNKNNNKKKIHKKVSKLKKKINRKPTKSYKDITNLKKKKSKYKTHKKHIFLFKKHLQNRMSSQFCYARRLVVKQSFPVNPVCESRTEIIIFNIRLLGPFEN